MFKALVVEKNEETGEVNASVTDLDLSDLPSANVTVAIEYSTVNYKDGLCMGKDSLLVEKYPHVPGIDFAGTVETSEDSRYKPGDKVVLTGWHVGENWWGGFSQKARVNAAWLVPLPEGIDTRQAMAVGTAGLTAMLAVMALEDHDLTRDKGPVLVTGAAGGVGSVATAIFSKLGYEVAAVTGRPDTAEYLRSLGASQIVAREELNTTVEQPMEAQMWAGCIDAVAGTMLSRILGQMKYGASVAAIGLAGGIDLHTTIIPFLLPGINLLGIDSVEQQYENRLRAWSRIAAGELPFDKLEAMTNPKIATLAELPELGSQILSGKVKGRIVVDVNS